MAKIASVVQSVATQEAGGSLTSTNTANFPKVSCARDQKPGSTYERVCIFVQTIVPGYVHKASVSHTGLIIVLTTVEKLYAESNTMPTVRFLREIVYALEQDK